MTTPTLAEGLRALALSAPSQPTLKENPTLYGIRTYLYGKAVKGYTKCTLPLIYTKYKADMVLEYLREQGMVVLCEPLTAPKRAWLITVDWHWAPAGKAMADYYA